MALFAIAWRNLWRHRRRSLITATGMGVAVAMCMGMYAFLDGFTGQMNDVLVGQTLGHAQIHAPAWPTRHQLHDTVGDVEVLVARLEETSGAAAVSPRVFSFGLGASAETSTGVRVAGIDPAREDAASRLGERIRDGEYLRGDDREGALVGKALAATLKLGVGDELILIVQAADGSMGNALYTVRGIFQSGNALMDRAGVYLTLAEAQSLLALEEQAHEIVLVAPSADEADAMTDRVKAALAAPEGGYLVRSWQESDPQMASMLQSQQGMGVLMVFIIYAVASLGILNTMLMAVMERTRELGLLRSLGLTPGQIRRLVLMEAALLGGLSCVGGLALGIVFDALLVVYGIPLTAGEEPLDYLGMTMPSVIYGVVKPGSVAVTLLLVFVVAILAAIWPALRASRLKPVDAMRQV